MQIRNGIIATSTDSPSLPWEICCFIGWLSGLLKVPALYHYKDHNTHVSLSQPKVRPIIHHDPWHAYLQYHGLHLMMILNGSHSLQQEGVGVMIQAGRPGPLQNLQPVKRAQAPWTGQPILPSILQYSPHSWQRQQDAS